MTLVLLYFVILKNVQLQFQPCRPQLTSTVPVAKVRESPDVAQANTVADTGEKKLIFATPLPSGKADWWFMDRRGRARHRREL